MRYPYHVTLSAWEPRPAAPEGIEWRRVAWVQAGTTTETLTAVVYQDDMFDSAKLAKLIANADYQLQQALYRQLDDFQRMGDAVADGLRALCEGRE